MVKLWSNCKRSTPTQVIRNLRVYCGLDSRFPDILSNGRAKIFSLCNIEAVMKVVLLIYYSSSMLVQVPSCVYCDETIDFLLFIGRVRTHSTWKQRSN